MKRMKRLTAVVIIAIMIPLAAGMGENAANREVHPPTCTEAGYTKTTGADGSITMEPGEPARGHTFGKWQKDEKTGKYSRTCPVCGLVETEEAGISALPRIDLNGSFEGIGKKERVLVRFEYREEGLEISCFSYTSWQGHSSLTAEKKNFTIRLFADEEMEDKNREVMRPGWQAEHKYILKANYHDLSLSRNLTCAEIWGEMAACREGIPERLKKTSNYGAVCGFPVTVYHDGEFLGLYTMNLHKDDDLYGLRYGSEEAIMICNRAGTQAGLFRAEATFETTDWEKGDWEVEYSGTDDDSWVKDSFNELIRFVMTADDEQFKEGLSAYMDVNSAIDYLIFLYAMGLTESADKDLTMIRYADAPWIVTVYDMEDAFGLSDHGSEVLGPEEFLPKKGADGWTTNTGSLLWDRIMNVYTEEIVNRYKELRRSVLTEENIRAKAESILNGIPEWLVEKDYELYPGRNAVSGDREKLLEYIHERLPLLDDAMTGER